MTSKKLEDSIMDTLKQARADRDRLDNLIAGLELTLEAQPTSKLQRKPPRAAAVAEPVNGKRRVRSFRGPRSAKGEMDAAVLAALAHYDGQSPTTTQVVNFVAKNRPPSLLRKSVSHASWRSRVLGSLERMEKRGGVSGQVSGTTRTWTVEKSLAFRA